MNEDGGLRLDEVAGETAPSRDPADVVMKGGITSGVLYPSLLHEIGSKYRICGIGGASAGAIGAAVGAAAEFGHASGGFERLKDVPAKLGDGRLAALFQPQPSTRQVLRLMLVATGNDRPGRPRTRWSKVFGVVGALFAAFPLAVLVGAAPGVLLMVIGALTRGLSGWLLLAAGAVVTLVGIAVALLLRLWRKFTVDVPGNLFGICRGLGTDPAHKGFTEWLGDEINDIAGLPVDGDPLTFGDLWKHVDGTEPRSQEDRRIDLRMITTCLSEGRPYELPWQARCFFFDPVVWRTLFPERVVQALERAAPAPPTGVDDAETWRWEDAMAQAHDPPLRRLPEPKSLPVIVATRLSLSFPLLVSAVPLWTIDRDDQTTRARLDDFHTSRQSGAAPPTSGVRFRRVWFTDGGFCSNFPVHLFDSALPSRPTFAINLGRFPKGQTPDADERRNIEWARNNDTGLSPAFVQIPTRGAGAVVGFASAAINTSRNWQDNSHLDHPGYRDRIVRILQTRAEGGLNLHMGTEAIGGLTERGRVAAEVIIEQFTTPRYPEGAPVATGWDNHRWVRYRALLSVLPAWLRSYARGHQNLDIDDVAPPSYPLSPEERALAAQLAMKLDELAAILPDHGDTTEKDLIKALTHEPRPQGILRRIPLT